MKHLRNLQPLIIVIGLIPFMNSCSYNNHDVSNHPQQISTPQQNYVDLEEYNYPCEIYSSFGDWHNNLANIVFQHFIDIGPEAFADSILTYNSLEFIHTICHESTINYFNGEDFNSSSLTLFFQDYQETVIYLNQIYGCANYYITLDDSIIFNSNIYSNYSFLSDADYVEYLISSLLEECGEDFNVCYLPIIAQLSVAAASFDYWDTTTIAAWQNYLNDVQYYLTGEEDDPSDDNPPTTDHTQQVIDADIRAAKITATFAIAGSLLVPEIAPILIRAAVEGTLEASITEGIRVLAEQIIAMIQ